MIGTAALDAGLYLKQAEVHGMSQRGGDVQSNLRLSDSEILSDLIPEGKADVILSIEPMESLRYLPMLSRDGWLITNTNPHVNIPDYPDIELLMNEIEKVRNHVKFDAKSMAMELQAPRSANMIILGAATPYIELEYEWIQKAIERIFKEKGAEVVQKNLDALMAGRQISLGRI